jgi:hypothetical protein
MQVSVYFAIRSNMFNQQYSHTSQKTKKVGRSVGRALSKQIHEKKLSMGLLFIIISYFKNLVQI